MRDRTTIVTAQVIFLLVLTTLIIVAGPLVVTGR